MLRLLAIIGTIALATALSVFVGYYVHLKPASVPPFPPATGAKNNYSPEQFHRVLSVVEKKRVFDSEFRVVRSAEEIPNELKQAFAAATGQQQFALANPGQKYQVTDVIDEPGLPLRRLLFAGESQKDRFIHYEHGGIGHSYAVLVFSKAEEGGVQFFWGGVGSQGAKDLEDLRNKIAAGDFRDDLVYYW
jgi:hypothetical protein